VLLSLVRQRHLPATDNPPWAEISDFYPRPQNMAHLLRMYNMEKIVCDKITGKYRFGFGHCEALVSIAGRCANNTFPVYWKTPNATFPR